MIIGIPKETRAGETRVALVPDAMRMLKRDQHEVLVEAGAGIASGVTDEDYVQAGATIVTDVAALYQEANIIWKVQPPQTQEAEMLRAGTAYLGYLDPWSQADLIGVFVRKDIMAFAIELVPRIARAQSMDALSSMATVAGYKAVLLATEHLGKMLPLMMTAAGTIPPARVLVLGAGVAGLQAIAMAHRMGARVEAFDPRPEVQEQVQSLGASFIAMSHVQITATAGGYATEQSASFLEQERAIISTKLPDADVVICAAQVFGKAAPRLITAAMMQRMHAGAVIVDLAADQGGNCELMQPGTAMSVNGVTIIGATNLPATLPMDASRLYAHNLANLFQHLCANGGFQGDSDDAIVRAVCVTRGGAVVNAMVQATTPTGVAG
jgi:NAD(P) transhydrogenase subunit alpha